MEYSIVRATEGDRSEILSLYKMQFGREFCPWGEGYPSDETIDFDLSRDALFVMKTDGSIKAAISLEEKPISSKKQPSALPLRFRLQIQSW